MTDVKEGTLITVRELAAELGVDGHDVLLVLQDIRELALSVDSPVRSEAAEIVRNRLLNQSGSTGDGTEGRPVGDTSMTPTISLTPLSRPRTRRFDGKRNVKRSEVTDRSLRYLAEQIIKFDRRRSSNLDVFYPDEFEIANERRAAWVEQSLNFGLPLEDNDIYEWLVAFPNEVLSPREVLPLMVAGLKPSDVKVRLWYGRENPGRPTLFQQIVCGDISIPAAAEAVSKFRTGTAD